MNRPSRFAVETLEGRALLSGLTIGLTTDRSSYTIGQPVQITLTETNDTSQPITVTKFAGSDSIGITSGATAVWSSYNPTGIQPAFAYTITILPGQTYRRVTTWNGQPNSGIAAEPSGPLVVHTSEGPATTTIAIVPGRPAAEYTPVVPTHPLNGTINTTPITTAPDPQGEAGTLYESILGRSADQAGLDAATAEIKAGASVSSVALGLLHSAEHDAQVAATDYYGYLGRAGSSSEIALWVAAMQKGLSEQQVAAGFLASTEFSADHASNADFVTTVFGDVLGRSPTATELTAVGGQLTSGTSRAVVAANLLLSPDAEALAIQSFYQSALNRAADTAGLKAALTGLANGSLTLDAIDANLLGSPEHRLFQG